MVTSHLIKLNIFYSFSLNCLLNSKSPSVMGSALASKAVHEKTEIYHWTHMLNYIMPLSLSARHYLQGWTSKISSQCERLHLCVRKDSFVLIHASISRTLYEGPLYNVCATKDPCCCIDHWLQRLVFLLDYVNSIDFLVPKFNLHDIESEYENAISSWHINSCYQNFI